ncbi:MAG TPA: hypothetical protein DIW47_15255 [Bacteroidetes bacterium]|nr:hypothetical protein [Bacteroidota bacterium]
MAYEKLTYGGSEEKSYLYFAFRADTFDTEAISTELGIQPTSVMIKKDPVPKSTAWKFKIMADFAYDLETPLQNLVGVFESKIEAINLLKQRLNLETQLVFVIYIDIDPEVSTPYFPMDKRVIDFLHKTQTTVDFDIYKADTIGLLEKL